MDQLRFVESQFRIEHRHDDGSWVRMEEKPQHHGAAEHDPERRWSIRRVFRCSRCDETITVMPGEAAQAAER